MGVERLSSHPTIAFSCRISKPSFPSADPDQPVWNREIGCLSLVFAFDGQVEHRLSFAGEEADSQRVGSVYKLS